MARKGALASELSPEQLAYLETWARAMAKAELIDRHIAEHGLFRANGELQPAMTLYVSLLNSARLSMARLEDSLRTTGLPGKGEDTLATIVAEYRRRDGSGA